MIIPNVEQNCKHNLSDWPCLLRLGIAQILRRLVADYCIRSSQSMSVLASTCGSDGPSNDLGHGEGNERGRGRSTIQLACCESTICTMFQAEPRPPKEFPVRGALQCTSVMSVVGAARDFRHESCQWRMSDESTVGDARMVTAKKHLRSWRIAISHMISITNAASRTAARIASRATLA
jgi:hypothetical protein